MRYESPKSIRPRDIIKRFHQLGLKENIDLVVLVPDSGMRTGRLRKCVAEPNLMVHRIGEHRRSDDFISWDADLHEMDEVYLKFSTLFQGEVYTSDMFLPVYHLIEYGDEFYKDVLKRVAYQFGADIFFGELKR